MKRLHFKISIILFLFLLSIPFSADATYNALMFPKFKWFDAANWTTASGWKVNTYENGTTTPKTSYKTPTGTANTNPVVLDSNGEADIYLDGTYTIVLTNASDVTQWTLNDVKGSSIESVVASVVATTASLGTGETDGEIAIDASTGNTYTWDSGGAKWRVQPGNAYATASLPSSTTYTIETGTPGFDTTLSIWKRWSGSAWVAVVVGNIVRNQVFN